LLENFKELYGVMNEVVQFAEFAIGAALKKEV
jgi:hypothetical protein